MKQTKKSKNFKMFILVQENEMEKPRWIEVNEINLGSLNKPNKNILQVRIEPIGDGFVDDFVNRMFREE
jgi:hypothetical protein